MFLKSIAIIAIIGACQAAEHAYSSQSIVLHHPEPKHHEPEHKEHYEATPIVIKKAVPVAQHIVSPKHEEPHHKPAVSSQLFERHDIPAPAPKGFSEHHGPSKYEFEYKVHDPHTGDDKYQHEARDGHRVQGVYSLHEADGSIRTVHYNADKKQGFQADIKHTTKHVEQKHHH